MEVLQRPLPWKKSMVHLAGVEFFCEITAKGMKKYRQRPSSSPEASVCAHMGLHPTRTRLRQLPNYKQVMLCACPGVYSRGKLPCCRRHSTHTFGCHWPSTRRLARGADQTTRKHQLDCKCRGITAHTLGGQSRPIPARTTSCTSCHGVS